MSEYQYVAFRAIDRALDDKQLGFAERQSSHSELSRWEMSVEYHYGSFRGNVDGLLRRGFDVHLAYANYGYREIKLRLPSGLPFSASTLKPFLNCDGISWKKDPKGNAGILQVSPFFECGEIDEVWNFGDYLESLAKVREQLIGGDLRAMYLLWLCAACDHQIDPEATIEPPVPHGLKTMPKRSTELLLFFGLDPLTLKAAADGVPGFDAKNGDQDPIQEWSGSISDARSRALLRRLLKEDPASLKAELLAEIRDSGSVVDWPTTVLGRSIDELLSSTDELREKANAMEEKKELAKAKREAAKAEKERQARMEKMKASPKTWLARAEKTAAERGTVNYQAAAEILADLREAIGGEKGKKLAHNCAVKMAKAHPTLSMLKSSLRKRGLLD
ncbi:hypothetical protein SAMN06265222_106341 [Neorhodopirellula lusitana]|uniref:Uncharacterized protein n=1 Tax=Neorhodopirellula lusitana TaxID=445327 RepID=A0ABY1Q9P5_9BACT|nr:hypothetical protein [Neorhodopirellula lusitana]SMP60255.1 hypothetical protein SAMN06265222_106341 [Neorhodopirellula lusitana]